MVLVLGACTPARVGGPVPPGDAGVRDAGPDGGRGCTGCINDTDTCVRGTSDTSCGQGGAMCTACSASQACVDGTCTTRDSCGPGDCEGCCNGVECITDNRDDACGGAGAACVACDSAESCVDGECVIPPDCNPGNCAGCCDGTSSVTGADTTACGAGGAMCAACEVGWACEAGMCVPPCAERCDGCCAGETCLDGATDESCGFGGAACVSCGAANVCSSGVCSDRTCSDTCDGCCDGDLCLSGGLSGACGASGSACVDCGDGFDCPSGACQVDPASRWNLRIVRATFSAIDPSGGAWDAGGGAPDPYAKVQVESGGSTLEESTERLDNTTSPTWDEVVLTGIRADDLMREVIIDIRDHDPITLDDAIVYCRWLPSNNAFVVGRVTLTCPVSSGPDTVQGQVTVALERT